MSARRLQKPPALAALLGALALALAGIAACLDLTPIIVPPKEAGAADGGCSACLELPAAEHGCLDNLTACRTDPGCGPLLRCVEEFACLDQPTIDAKLTCGIPCIQEAGITEVADPRVITLLQVVKCGQRECALACNLGDGGLGFDAF